MRQEHPLRQARGSHRHMKNSSSRSRAVRPSTSKELPEEVSQELDFRLSLYRLLTVPHQSATAAAPADSRNGTARMEELSMLVPRKRRR